MQGKITNIEYKAEKIISIKQAKPSTVYNISVKTDESYVANGIIVHNCRSRIVAYPYDYPGDRDFTKQTDGTKVTKKYGKSIDAQVTNFRTKYWKPAKVEIPKGAIKGVVGISDKTIPRLETLAGLTAITPNRGESK